MIERRPDCPFEALGGDSSNGSYGTRIGSRCQPYPRSEPQRNDVVYEFNTHMALPALISGAGLRKPVVAEVANIRNIQVASGPISHEARWIDKLTTHGYSRYYRNRLRSKTPRATIENKIDGRHAATVRANRMHSQSDRPLRIGRFRYLRNEWSPRDLLSLTRSTERFHVVLVG